MEDELCLMNIYTSNLSTYITNHDLKVVLSRRLYLMRASLILNNET